MSGKELKIPTTKEVKKQFEHAKIEIDADTHEQALIRLMLLCADNGDIEMVNTDILEDRLEFKQE